jgi:hypothetical protein
MPAVALWCVAFLLLLRGLSSRWRANFFYAGLLTGACSILREEGYLLLASAIVALSLRKRGIYDCLPVASGFAAVVLPLWVFQYCVYGNPAGIHALGYVSNFGGHFSFSNFLLGKMSNFYVYLFKFAPSFKVKDLFYGLLFFPFICACVAGIIFRRDIGKKGLAFLPPVAVASLILTLILWLLGVPVYSSIFTQGLFPAVPFMIIPVLFAGAVLKDKHPATRFTFLSVIFYVIFACLSLNQKDMGIIWGPRHFIFIIPALIPFVFSGKEALFRKNSGVFRVSVAIIFISAFLIQIYGIYSLYVKKKASAEIVQALEKLPRPIVTDIFWLPEEAAVLFYRKNILAVGGKVKLKDAIGKIRAKGVNSFGLVLSNKFRRIKDKELAETLNSLNVTGCERLNLPDTPFLNLVMLNCSTGP